MAPLHAGEVLYFMSVAEDSFEERRIHDYLSAYRATARPPAPCPQSPDTPAARAALGLPPLFVPAAIPEPPDSDTAPDAPAPAPAPAPADLPALHECRPSLNPLTGESFQSIAAQTLYSLFSHEELRYHAYRSGNKAPSIATTTTTTMDAPTSAPVHPFYANDSPATAYLTSTSVPGPPDCFMSVAASPKFDKHSFEELRIAYLLAGKEVGSSEIPTRGALPAQAAPTLFGRPRGDAFSSGSSKFL